METDTLLFTLPEYFNYAMQQNHYSLIRDLQIRNNTEEDWENLDLEIETDPEFCKKFSSHLEGIPAGETLIADVSEILPNGDFLAVLSSEIKGSVTVRLKKEETILAEVAQQIEVLTYDQYPDRNNPGLLAAFVLPNHPALVPIIHDASEFLREWTGDPSLNAYLDEKPARVRNQLAALYKAIQKLNITYALPPANFLRSGQRVRLPEMILEERLGTCLDLALLFVSCLEAMGLNSLLVLLNDHAFAGVWLDEESFPDVIQDDVAALTKNAAEGIHNIALIECTGVTSGSTYSFEEAEKVALKNLTKIEKFEQVIDIFQARRNGIKPIPFRIKSGDSWTVSVPDRQDSELTEVPGQMRRLDLSNYSSGNNEPKTRSTYWEHRLLDLSMHNPLLNMRFRKGSKMIIPLLSDNLGDLEDAISGNVEFLLESKPDNFAIPEDFSAIMEMKPGLGAWGDLLSQERKNKRLRTILTEKETEKTALDLYRRAKVSLEENGANTLYLALGFLRWYEKPNNDTPRYAPIILLPVEMKRKSNRKGFSIILRDEETQINISLLEMLRERFQIDINNLDPLPCDEKGIDLVGIFTIIRKAVFEQKGWDIVENAVLGIFFFTQFVMWNDLKNNLDKLRQSKVVASLLDEKLNWVPDPFPGDDDLEDGMFVPVSADASQLVAVKAAATGKSFVLHGPPGTGKSQTITNIIANALAQGQRVLFVAEKMAALSVVQKRLEKIGLGPYCLELHSNKSTKKDVLIQLDNALNAGNNVRPSDFSDKTKDLASRREFLKSYVRALHRKQPSGMTLYELISRYESVRNADDLEYPIPSCSKTMDGSAFGVAGKLETAAIRGDLINYWKDLIRRTVAHLRAMRTMTDHPLKEIGRDEFTQTLKEVTPDKIAALKNSIDALIRSSDVLGSAYSIRINGKKREYEKLVSLCPVLTTIDEIPKSWLKQESIVDFLNLLGELIELGGQEKNCRENILRQSNPDILNQDGRMIQEQWRGIKAKWFIPRFFAQKKFHKKMVSFIGSVMPADWDLFIDELLRFQDLRQKRKDKARSLGFSFTEFDQGDQTDWEDLTCKKLHLQKCYNELKMFFYDKTDNLLKRSENVIAAEEKAGDYQNKWNEFITARKDLFDLLDIDIRLYENDGQYLKRLRDACEIWQSSLGDLRDWILWRKLAGDLRQSGLEAIEKICSQGTTLDLIEKRFEKSLLKKLILYAFESAPELNVFSARTFEEQISEYKKLMSEYELLTAWETAGRLAEKIPDPQKAATGSSEIAILLKMIKSGGRAKSLRKLFSEIPNLLPRLCPCLLMSPISVAQYLDPGRDPFDLIVFDEASQLPTCKAIGALARGKNAVIVGDPKQLPPTSFFTINSSNDENTELMDLESILDDCLALAMPNTKLRWHYRSRHESLIAFSNRQYYGNELFTFPSVNDRISKVHFVPVSGFYDRSATRTNRAEAEAVRDEVMRRLRDPDLQKQSIGIVTFSVAQQNLIDDLISEAYVQYPELEAKAHEHDEPLFIKNLENVQGDERDVILFSIGYGPDKEGKVMLNFGPINKPGGWRRLNVAISRARCEMTVFATLQPDQIDLSRTSSEGVVGLKAFLEFASGKYNNYSQEDQKTQKNVREGILQSIADYLADFGYQTRIQVGRSGYRVDLGVFDQDDPEKYLLGILIDGVCYKNAKTVREREYAQADVLRHLGWRLFRVWSVEWWEDRDKILAQIYDAVKKAVEENRAQALAVVQQKMAREEERKSGQKESDIRSNSPKVNSSKNFESNSFINTEANSGTISESESISAAETASVPSDSFDLPLTEIETIQSNNKDNSVSGQAEGSVNFDSPVNGFLKRPPNEGGGKWAIVNGESIKQEAVMEGAVKGGSVNEEEVKQVPEKDQDLSKKTVDGSGQSERPKRNKYEEVYIQTRLPAVSCEKEAFHQNSMSRTIMNQIQQVIDQEGPLSLKILTKRVMDNWGMSRATKIVEERIKKILKQCSFKKTTDLKVAFYWPAGVDVENYKIYRVAVSPQERREINDISTREIAVAVFSVLGNQISMDRSDLIKEVYKLFGFSRTSENIEKRINAGIDFACQKNWAVNDNERIILGKDDEMR